MMTDLEQRLWGNVVDVDVKGEEFRSKPHPTAFVFLLGFVLGFGTAALITLI